MFLVNIDVYNYYLMSFYFTSLLAILLDIGGNFVINDVKVSATDFSSLVTSVLRALRITPFCLFRLYSRICFSDLLGNILLTQSTQFHLSYFYHKDLMKPN